MPQKKVGRGKVFATVVREPIASLLENLTSDLGFPSTSSLINWIIRDWLERRNLLHPKAPAKLPAGVYAEPGGPTRGHEPQPLEEAVEGVGTGG